MWGKVIFDRNNERRIRITPTHVGKSFRIVIGQRQGTGSPPPMWGKEVFAKVLGVSVGITPTHVGKRDHGQDYTGLAKDHPHPCGEKSIT